MNKNLYLKTQCHVNKLIFSEKNKKQCTGVEYYENGVKKLAYANKEVIMSSGSINNVQLLELSGIG
jgi:choline dehydrogenase